MIKLNDDKIVILVLMLKNPLGVCTFRYGYSEAFVLSGCPQQRGSEISFQRNVNTFCRRFSCRTFGVSVVTIVSKNMRFSFKWPYVSTGIQLPYYWGVPREDKGDREGIPHTHPIPQVIRLELFLRPQIPRGIRQQPIIQRERVPRG